MLDITVGVNADPHFGLDQDLLGSQVVRFPLWPGFDYNPFIQKAHDAGALALAVLDDQSMSDRGESETWQGFYARKSEEFPGIDWWQILNEVDNPNGAESGPQPGWYVSMHLWAARRALGDDAYIIGPGLVSANVAYVKDIRWEHCSAFAIHPYGQWFENPAPEGWFGKVEDLINLYSRVIDKYKLEIVISEFGAPGNMFDSEHDRAEYHSNMLATMNGLRIGKRAEPIKAALVYCLLDAQRPQDGGMGCFDTDNALKETGAAIASALGS